jgi:hypothetical protein
MSTVMEDLKRLEDRILARIHQLEANVAELDELRAVAARLGILDGHPGNGPAAIPGPTATIRPRPRPRRAGSGQASGTAVRPGGARTATRGSASRPTARNATRRERVLEVVGDEPGISVREIVAQLGFNRTSLYPVVRQLVSDGLLYKDGRGLWPVSA